MQKNQILTLNQNDLSISYNNTVNFKISNFDIKMQTDPKLQNYYQYQLNIINLKRCIEKKFIIDIQKDFFLVTKELILILCHSKIYLWIIDQSQNTNQPFEIKYKIQNIFTAKNLVFLLDQNFKLYELKISESNQIELVPLDIFQLKNNIRYIKVYDNILVFQNDSYIFYYDLTKKKMLKKDFFQCQISFIFQNNIYYVENNQLKLHQKRQQQEIISDVCSKFLNNENFIAYQNDQKEISFIFNNKNISCESLTNLYMNFENRLCILVDFYNNKYKKIEFLRIKSDCFPAHTKIKNFLTKSQSKYSQEQKLNNLKKFHQCFQISYKKEAFQIDGNLQNLVIQTLIVLKQKLSNKKQVVYNKLKQNNDYYKQIKKQQNQLLHNLLYKVEKMQKLEIIIILQEFNHTLKNKILYKFSQIIKSKLKQNLYDIHQKNIIHQKKQDCTLQFVSKFNYNLNLFKIKVLKKFFKKLIYKKNIAKHILKIQESITKLFLKQFFENLKFLCQSGTKQRKTEFQSQKKYIKKDLIQNREQIQKLRKTKSLKVANFNETYQLQRLKQFETNSKNQIRMSVDVHNDNIKRLKQRQKNKQVIKRYLNKKSIKDNNFKRSFKSQTINKNYLKDCNKKLSKQKHKENKSLATMIKQDYMKTGHFAKKYKNKLSQQKQKGFSKVSQINNKFLLPEPLLIFSSNFESLI